MAVQLHLHYINDNASVRSLTAVNDIFLDHIWLSIDLDFDE